MFNKITLDTNDEYYTPKSAWKNIAQYLPRDKVIYECFYSPHSKSAQYLRELGFTCVYEPVDFFTTTLNDVNADYYLSNMPFSLKREVFTRLKEVDQPFVMLVPTSCLQTKYFQDLFGRDKIQVILPYKKIQYEHPTRKLKKRGCAFYSCYVCYKMNLEKDIIFI